MELKLKLLTPVITNQFRLGSHNYKYIFFIEYKRSKKYLKFKYYNTNSMTDLKIWLLKQLIKEKK